MRSKKYKILFMHAQDAIYIVDDRGRIIDVNPSGCTMLGYTHDELVGRPMNELYYDDNSSGDVPEADQAEGEGLIEERLMIRKDGTRVPVEFSRTMMPDGNMQMIVRDITERKRVEERFRTRDAEYRDLIENMDESFAIFEMMTDAAGRRVDFRIVEANPAFRKLTKDVDPRGKMVSEVFPVITPSWHEKYEQVIRTGKAVRFSGVSEGVQRYVTVFVYPIPGNGMRVGILFLDITESKRYEKELQESKTLLAETERAGRIGGWSIDTRTMEQTWTEETFHILEIERSNGALNVPEGMSFIHAEYQSMAAEAVNRALQAGEPYDQEWKIVTAKGNERWVHSIGNVYKNNGKIVRVAGSFQDITERKQAELALRESRELLAQTERMGHIGGFSLDARTMAQSWTDEIYTILEYDQDLKIPDLPEMMNHVLVSSGDEIRELLHQAIDLGKPFDREWEIQTFKGNRRWVHVVARPIQEGGRTTRLTGSVQDVTERRQAEEALRKREREYRDLVNSMEEAFCIIEMLYDEDGNPSDYRFLEVNPMFEKHTGLIDAAGKTIRELVPEHDRHWFEYYGRVARTGESMHFEASAKAMRKQFSVFAYKIGGEGSNKVGIIFTEITERKAMEDVVKDVQRREAIGVLSAGIAHDFNNLLAVMMGNISLAQAEIPAGSRIEKFLSQTMTAIESAADLTRQMLAYSGKGKFLVEPVDLVSEIRKNVSLLTVSVPKNVRLGMNLPSKKVFITGDRGQIKQILMNLVINGGDAIGEKQGKVTVSVSVAAFEKKDLAPFEKIPATELKPGRYALLEVSDTGSGMSAETLARIFDPFFTTKFIGRGLGLSAVLGIIKGHEGGIVIESTEGVGSTFRVILPCCEVEHETEAAAFEIRPEIPAGDNGARSADDPSTTVLVIDDEAEVAEMACELLASADYRSIAETNPLRAIDVFREHQSEIGVILLDWSMPEMNGREAAHALHEIDPWARIIITSGYSEEEIKSKLGTEAVAGVLQKPYSMEALHAVVEKVAAGAPGRNGERD